MIGRLLRAAALVLLLLSAGGDGAKAQGIIPTLTGSVSAPAQVSDPQADAPSLHRQLDEAQAEYARASRAGAVPAALPAELLERDYLLGEWVAALERHLDIVERRPEALRRAADQEEQSRTLTVAVKPASVSILTFDHQRDLLEDTRARLKAATLREGFRDQQISDEEKRLRAAEVTIRQQTERIDGGTTVAQKARDSWLRDLARLRSRVAAAGMAEAKAAKSVDQAEIAELRTLSQGQEQQLVDMRSSVHFTEADLNTVLADLDRQIAPLQTRLVRIQAASAQSHRQLDQVQRAVATVKAAETAAPPARRPAIEARRRVLEHDLALRRLQADTDDLADDTLRRMIEIRGWERAGWQFRWHLFAVTTDRDKRREATETLIQTAQKLENWQHYLGDEIARTSQLGEDESTSLAVVQTTREAELNAALRSAYRQRAATLREAGKLVESVLHTVRTWVQELQSREIDKPLSTVAHDGWAEISATVRAVWDFELFTAEDSMEVDGKRITTARSITIGKSLGVILLVVLGSVLSRRLLSLFGALFTAQFKMQKDYASTVTRWLHILIVTMLFVVALYVANIPLTVFAFFGGALAIGVGFGTQVILKNMISGIILLIERPLRVGDIVAVGGVTGTVTHINVRSSTVRSADGIETLVPNSTFIENNVTNWTYSNARVCRTVAVGTDYSVAPERTAAVLMAVARSTPEVLEEPQPSVLLDEFGADSYNFILRYWIDYSGGTDSAKIASDLRFKIAAELAAAGIAIPFPQRVVHLYSEPGPA